MTTVKLTPANGQAKEEVPDLAAVMAKLGRVAVRAEHTVACEYVHAAHRLVYAMQ